MSHDENCAKNLSFPSGLSLNVHEVKIEAVGLRFYQRAYYSFCGMVINTQHCSLTLSSYHLRDSLTCSVDSYMLHIHVHVSEDSNSEINGQEESVKHLPYLFVEQWFNGIG